MSRINKLFRNQAQQPPQGGGRVERGQAQGSQADLHSRGETSRVTGEERHLPAAERGGNGGSNQTNVRVSNLIYEASPKHHQNVSGGFISAAPTNGQAALDASIQIKPTSPRRVAVDAAAQEFVVFDQTTPGVFHGHVRTFDQLSDQMKAVLRKAGLVNAKGRITGAQRCDTNSPSPSLPTRLSLSFGTLIPTWSARPWSGWSTATSIFAGLRRGASTLRRALTSRSARPQPPAWATWPASTGSWTPRR